MTQEKIKIVYRPDYNFRYQFVYDTNKPLSPIIEVRIRGEHQREYYSDTIPIRIY